jgi:hypothetical protein
MACEDELDATGLMRDDDDADDDGIWVVDAEVFEVSRSVVDNEWESKEADVFVEE